MRVVIAVRTLQHWQRERARELWNRRQLIGADEAVSRSRLPNWFVRGVYFYLGDNHDASPYIVYARLGLNRITR
jgi:hypothetical protein